jgi:hypothetical protein
MVSTSDVFMLFRKVKGIVEYMPRELTGTVFRIPELFDE